MATWLLKTEPETYSFQDLLKDRKTAWDGVRNFQARNHLQSMKPGDQALIYHSGKDKAVVGIAEVIKAAYPDPDPKKKGDWVKVDLKPVRAFQRPVTLSEIKSHSKLKDLTLVKQSRLSVMPVNSNHFQLLLKLGEKK